MAATRIVPKYEARGLLPLALAIGLIWGGLSIPVAEWAEHVAINRPAGPSMGTFVACMIVYMTLPCIALTVWHSRLSRRIRPILLAASFMALGMFLAAFLHVQLSNFDAGARSNWIGWELLIPAAVFPAAGVLLALLFRWLTLRVVNPVEQTGLLCWSCGYDLGSPAITVCPECAEPAAPHRFRREWLWKSWNFARRLAPALAALTLFIGLGWCTYRLAVIRPPYARFIARLIRPGLDTQQWIYLNRGQQSFEWDGLLAQHPLNDGTDRVIGYAYWPRGVDRAGREHVRMRIFLAEKRTHTFTLPVVGGPPTTETMVVQPAEGSVRVYADLDEGQSQQVIRDGQAPRSLIAALLAEAEIRGWKPSAATTWGPDYGAEDAPVDPEQHFKDPAPPVQPGPTTDR